MAHGLLDARRSLKLKLWCGASLHGWHALTAAAHARRTAVRRAATQ
jgi:hypothetical protein